MASLFRNLEAMASNGAGGLTPDAHTAIVDALARLQRPDGGCAAPSGTPDAYYSCFAWLCLRALDPAAPAIPPLERYLLTCPAASPVDKSCARLVQLNAASRTSPLARLRPLLALLLSPPRDLYASFLYALALDAAFASGLPAFLKRRIAKKISGARDGPQTATPRLAAKLTLTQPGTPAAAALASLLLQRRRPTGGFASSAAAPAPDLLATAVARFALASCAPAALTPADTAADLAFTETCWTDDALFAPAPYSTHGDSEHTFYALLALGSCIRNQG